MDTDEFSQHLLEAETNNKTTYIEDIDADIDNGLTELIKTINQETPIDTFMSCSGLLEDHYDLDYLREHNVTPFNANDPRPENFGNLQHTYFYIQLTTPYHETDDDGNLHINHKYFQLKSIIENIGIYTRHTYPISFECEMHHKPGLDLTIISINATHNHRDFLYETINDPTYSSNHDIYKVSDENLKDAINTLTLLFNNYDKLLSLDNLEIKHWYDDNKFHAYNKSTGEEFDFPNPT